MANNMLTAQIEIQGTRPFLFNWFGPDTIPLEKKERTGVAGNDPEEWKRTYRATEDGTLYVNGDYAFGCLKEGAVYTKRGRSNLQKSLRATLRVLDDIILMDRRLPDPISLLETKPYRDPSLPVYLDVRSVINPGSGARNLRYRVAASAGWKMTFSIEWDKTVVSRNEMEAIAIDGGRFEGIGNGRKIGMGRFDVVKFEVLASDAFKPTLAYAVTTD